MIISINTAFCLAIIPIIDTLSMTYIAQVLWFVNILLNFDIRHVGDTIIMTHNWRIR